MPEIEILKGETNPIDSVEDILSEHNWEFNRMNNDELIVDVKGKNCHYRLLFVWQEDMNALQFGCHYDLDFSPHIKERAYKALPAINESLWLGHFDLPKGTNAPIFRYTCLFSDSAAESHITNTIENMVDIALSQCEKHYPAFYVLSSAANDMSDNNLSLALMETTGQA